ncbi:sialidase-1 [Capnocytophaga haemolytica]|uniref:exo-alpha-sialidase n=1 Tax=Capnocytophaga haemolytica TaxID=45243 RepID=A0AAX2GWL4_9FLAO|nr:sialidase family protein [Capnocytophaga haemolytica]AMD84831.1 sialidase [Capnocytophaga haemolytica]SFN75779.1 sialidase-1 [Capnocytophaga haemolytica]SNV06988.1 Sialidase precursor [Capnocytophaga haemolytica]
MKTYFLITMLLLSSLSFAQGRFTQPQMPLSTEQENLLASFSLPVKQGAEITALSLTLQDSHHSLGISHLSVYVSESDQRQGATLYAQSIDVKHHTELKGRYTPHGKQLFVWLTAKTVEQPDLLATLYLKSIKVHTTKGAYTLKNSGKTAQRYAITLRQRKQDGIECYRIPGLVTTPKGTLIGVYDNRYNNCKDLQEDINIGMSRSTDGGQTWGPMKEIMDMGTWGNLPQQLNGIGDPAVLVDEQTGTLYVMALWQHGLTKDDTSWWGSKPGMTPNETAQVMLTKSTDDGLTWSTPTNITEQIKKPEWYLLFQGPGRGITMADGTLVFAGQFRDAQQVPHSTIIYSTDHGEHWQIGTGAKTNTTEAQVVQLPDGSLMLNMRDDRNRHNFELSDNLHGRSVYTTRDMGKTWSEHPTSRKALVEPNCMASLIAYTSPKGKHYLFFSNPADAQKRIHLTIKASADNGLTWDKLPQKMLYEGDTMGYSCMTLIEGKYIGILYEGAAGELYFQKIPISDFIK